MPTSVPDSLDARLLALLPTDGTPVLNRVMRAMLGRACERPIAADAYFSARDRLLSERRIGRLRGQGGQVFLATEPPAPDVPSADAAGEVGVEAWAEARLMSPLKAYLEGPFREGLDLGDALCLVQDTSTIGRGQWSGQWSRPDFILVSAMRFRLLPGAQVDVHAFELKTESGGTVQAVHEALAQTRFTHFGHLVWHLPEGSKAEARLAEIEAQCEAHGIGLIRMRDPKRPGTGEILIDPRRRPTLPAVIDGFLESRLSVAHRTKLEAAVRNVRG
ncbi:hypothetical protein [uncultured Methylobacterium sp.]|uniref:hypothetical protein n=1 Tax=uncultured Methylobacterium sp. TaxID=157278 RepID=UPI0035CBBF75